eukprot:Tbor_TRINITY_DN6176_c1_g4::TRINITY_DN6176_c1_g4_i1::g.22385::m.22385
MAEKEGLLFKMKQKSLRPFLKKHGLECRSFRKGKLIVLTLMPIEEIMAISQHPKSSTLFKYIGFNVNCVNANKKKEINIKSNNGDKLKKELISYIWESVAQTITLSL